MWRPENYTGLTPQPPPPPPFPPTPLNVRSEVKDRLIGVRSNTFHVFDRPSKAIILKVIESVLDLWKGRITNVSKILLYLRIILRENSFYFLLFLSSEVWSRHLRENIRFKKYIFKRKKKGGEGRGVIGSWWGLKNVCSQVCISTLPEVF